VGSKNPIDKSLFFLTLILIMCIEIIFKIFVDRLNLDFFVRGLFNSGN
jgi:hypothetical protein